MTRIFASLDSRRAAEFYSLLKPLFAAAYAELGYADKQFETVVFPGGWPSPGDARARGTGAVGQARGDVSFRRSSARVAQPHTEAASENGDRKILESYRLKLARWPENYVV